MGLLSMLNRSNVNRHGIREFKGSMGDSESVVNQFGMHDHAAGLGNNAIEAAADASMMMGPVGTVVNGANAIRHAFKGNWGSALKSVGKGLLSLIPGVGAVVGGVSLLKDGVDMVSHAGGWAQQSMRGGYDKQNQMVSRMFGMGSSGGLANWYGGNHAMAGGAYGQMGYGGNYGYGMSPGRW